MMRFLKLSSLLLLLLVVSCSSPYRKLQSASASSSALRFKPVYERELYRCTVDGGVLFKKFHLSGLLLFKELETGTRVVFQNEMGISFFDFEWDKNDSFKVNSIVEQLDKPAVIKTLQKDMAMLLMKDLDTATETHYQKENEIWHRFTLDKGFVYYIENSARLVRILNTGERRKVTTTSFKGRDGVTEMPRKALIEHHRANFKIQLKKIDGHVNE
jgi:hypothetical protein